MQLLIKLFMNSCESIGVILTVILFTLVFKILLMPVYIIRKKNQYLKERIYGELDKLKKEIRQAKDKITKQELKRQKQFLIESNSIKDKKFMFIIFLVELTILILLTNLFRNYNIETYVLWFDISKRDSTFILPIINILFCGLGMYFATKKDFFKIPNMIMLALMLYMIFKLTSSSASILVIYFIISNIFSMIINIVFSRYSLRNIKKETKDVNIS